MKTLLALGIALTLGCARTAPPPASPETPAPEPAPPPVTTSGGSWWCFTDDLIYADGQADEACSASEDACQELIQAMREIDGTEGGPCTPAE